MSNLSDQIKEKPPEYRVFTEALSLAISVSNDELQQRLKKTTGEKVSRYKIQVRPQSPSLNWEAPCRRVAQVAPLRPGILHN